MGKDAQIAIAYLTYLILSCRNDETTGHLPFDGSYRNRQDAKSAKNCGAFATFASLRLNPSRLYKDLTGKRLPRPVIDVILPLRHPREQLARQRRPGLVQFRMRVQIRLLRPKLHQN